MKIRKPDLTLRNALLTPAIFLVRVPLLLAGAFLSGVGGVLQFLGEKIPGWTDNNRRSA